jgi:integrase
MSGSFRSHRSFAPLSRTHASAIATHAPLERSKGSARTGPAPKLRGASKGLRQAFARSRKRAGIEPFGLQDLRHYFVTAFFRRGVAAPTVQALAGHAHLPTTERYAHVARMDLRAAIERLAG